MYVCQSHQADHGTRGQREQHWTSSIANLPRDPSRALLLLLLLLQSFPWYRSTLFQGVLPSSLSTLTE